MYDEIQIRSDTLGRFAAGEIRYLAAYHDRLAMDPADDRSVRILGMEYRSLENRLILLASDLEQRTRFERREELIPHAFRFSALMDEIKYGRQRLAELRAGGTVTEVLERTGQRLDDALQAFEQLIGASGPLTIWVENPVVTELGDLREAMLAREPNHEEYLARCAVDFGKDSSIRYRDAFATVVWRGGWRNPAVKGRERAYILKAVAGILSGGDDLNRLAESITIGDSIDEAGQRVRAVPAILDEPADVILYGCDARQDLPVHRPQLIERRSLDLTHVERLGLPPDAIVLLRAILEGITHTKLPGHLTETTGELWDMRRVWAAEKALERRRGCLRVLARTDYLWPRRPGHDISRAPPKRSAGVVPAGARPGTGGCDPAAPTVSRQRVISRSKMSKIAISAPYRVRSYMRCELAILYRPEGGAAITIAAVADRELIRATAMRAIEESERAAEAMADADELLGEMQRLEARRLRGVLATLLPDCLGPADCGVLM